MAFMAVTCAQALVWERWIVPLLPFLALAAAAAICAAGDGLRKRIGHPMRGFEAAATLLLLVPLSLIHI